MPTATSTALKKAKFLAAYAEAGTALEAERRTGIPSRTHRFWLKQSPEYAEAFAAAEEKSIERLEQEAIRRAVEGSEEPVYFEGRVVGTVHKKSDVLLIFLLKAKRPEVFRDRIDSRVSGHVGVETTVTVIHELHEGPAAQLPPSSFTPQLPPAPGEDDPPFE